MTKKNKYTIIDLLIFSLVPLMLYTQVDNALVSVNIVYVLYILVFIQGILTLKKISVSNTKLAIFVGFFCGMFALPLFFFHIDTLNGLLYSILIIAFLFVNDIIGKRLSVNFNEIIKMWSIFGSLVVDITILKNIDGINIQTLTSSLISSSTRYRSFLGFNHPNSAALSIVVLLLLYYIWLKNNKQSKYRIIIYVLIAFNIIALICTNSRTAILCSILFIVFEITFKLLKKIKNVKLKLLIYMSIFILLILFVNKIDFTVVSEQSSGRFESIITNLNKLNKSGKLWFGYKVTSITNTNEVFRTLGIVGTDNWYFMQILRYGIVGLLFILYPIAIILKKLYKNYFFAQTDSYPLSALIALLFYGLGENVVWNQAVVLCLVVWSIIFSQLNRFTTSKRE